MQDASLRIEHTPGQHTPIHSLRPFKSLYVIRGLALASLALPPGRAPSEAPPTTDQRSSQKRSSSACVWITQSDFGIAEHVRMYPAAIWSASRNEHPDASTSPLSTFPAHDEQPPARHAYGSSCSSVSSSSSVASRMKVSGGFSYTTSSPLSVFSVTVNVALFGSAGGAAAAGGAASAGTTSIAGASSTTTSSAAGAGAATAAAGASTAGGGAAAGAAAAAAGRGGGRRAERGARRHVAGRHRALAFVAEEHVEAPAQLALGAPRALAVEHQLALHLPQRQRRALRGGRRGGGRRGRRRRLQQLLELRRRLRRSRRPAPSAASIDAAITGLKVEPRRPASHSVAKLSTLPIISSSHTFSTASRNLGATPARSASQERSGGAAEQRSTAAREVEGGERRLNCGAARRRR